MCANAATAASFRQRFYVWFDGLKAWRYVHQPSAQIPIEEAAAALLEIRSITPAAADAESLLMQYRRMVRSSGSTVKRDSSISRILHFYAPESQPIKFP